MPPFFLEEMGGLRDIAQYNFYEVGGHVFWQEFSEQLSGTRGEFRRLLSALPLGRLMLVTFIIAGQPAAMALTSGIKVNCQG